MNMESMISEILVTICQIKSDFSALSAKFGNIEQAVEYNSTDIAPIFINESLTFKRSKRMTEVRRKLKYVNEGRENDKKLRSKSSGGRLRIMKENREYVAITSLDDFHKIHPATRDY